jgi:hypothetical protein
MKRRFIGIAVAAVAVLCVLAGSAVAGNGNGNNGNGNGNQPAVPAPAPAAPTPAAPATHGNASAPGQQKKTQPAPAPAAAKKSSSTSSTAPGVKPGNTTKHWTHTTVGASPDVSKRYGNGKTAAQIAKSRGAPDNQPLTGPGNSQPHKTYDCAHKNNRSGGVDVHAIKSYSTSCTQTQQQSAPQQSTQVTQNCAGTTSVVTSVQASTKKEERGHAYGEERKDRNEGKTKSTSVVVVTPASGCSSSQPTQQTFESPIVVHATSPQAAHGAAGTSASKSSASRPSAGGVLGAQAALGRTAAPKAKPAGGVLGTIGRVAGTTLPFTGLQLWIAVLIAIALILGGTMLYRRSHARSTI